MRTPSHRTRYVWGWRTRSSPGEVVVDLRVYRCRDWVGCVMVAPGFPLTPSSSSEGCKITIYIIRKRSTIRNILVGSAAKQENMRVVRAEELVDRNECRSCSGPTYVSYVMYANDANYTSGFRDTQTNITRYRELTRRAGIKQGFAKLSSQQSGEIFGGVLLNVR